jgi:hypothetical protein
VIVWNAGEPMKLPRLFSGVLVALVGSAAASSAQASDVDWKMYGGASVSGAEICFYDAKGAVRTPDKYVGVWTKCLSQKDIDNVDIKHDFSGRIVENAARKMINGYVPPIALVEDIDFDQATVITGYEETANISGIKPHSNIFYEINCSQKMLRELSINLLVNGQHGSKDTPSAWRHIPPEGNGASLLKILCGPTQ